MIDSRSLEDLRPVVKAKAKAFLEACAKENIEIRITSTYRDAEAQNALYAQGRTKPGKRVTNAKAGQSMHNYRVAFDFAPMKNGKIDWNDTALFARCGKIAESVGLEWAGRWTTFKELAHCQYTGGLTLKDFQAGKQLEE
ncbi:MAG: M15 family metallopeptidase [Candidatus Accumulibacter sp.]|jgi:peptidoglycan L-alanyl-D-glutamate endopeptidase CwlK|nr:M15 family metallopeptidase [Accumulibacter sp.]